MTLVRVLYVCAACLFAALIVWATTRADIGESFGRIVADPWGLVALVDLYLGFAIASTVIWLAEGRRGLFWIVPLFVLGNVVAALWIARRLPDIAAALRARRLT